MGGRIDWEAARERVAKAGAAVTRGEPSEAEREAIFARRAERLAAPPPATEPADAFEVLVFALADERYAFPSGQVREVLPLRDVTPLPGTPAFIAGLINVRGRIVPILDLRPLFGLSEQPGQSGLSVMLVASARGDVGCISTGRPAIGWLRTSELGGLPAGTPVGLAAGYVRGVSPDLTILLDAEALLADERLIVQEVA